MSESSLATYVHYSPNCTKPRQGTIQGVAIHCTAGGRNLPARSFADMNRFAVKQKNGASCHYVVGGDGSIAQVCREENRAWCTSNPIDHQIITIEVASDADGECKCNLAALNSLIKLLVDICQRNNIPRLLWRGDKSLMGKWDEQNMVVHRWTANKACVPVDSEVLTRNGWVKISEIQIGEEIACADLDNLRISFEEVYDKVEEHQHDTYTNNGLTATKDHRMVYSAWQSKNFFRIATYNELLHKRNNVYIPLAGYSNFDGLDMSMEMISFLVAVQADGHYMYDKRVDGTKSYYGLEFHFSKHRKVERIIEILNSLHIPYRTTNQSNGTTKIRIYNYDGINVVQEMCERYLNNKAFTWNFINMNQEQALWFLNELLFWDGCKAANLYTSRNHENLDVVSAIAALNGVGARVSGDNIGFRESPFMTLSKENTRRNNKHSRGNITNVTCVSVKTGVFLCRQNGKTFIIGNCPGDYLYNKHAAIAQAVNNRLGAETEDEDMDINKLLAEMTGAQAYALYTKAMTFAAAVAEPEWSKKQGHWEKATLKGVVDGQEPERPVKRDELAAVLGRLGVLD